MEKRTEHPSPDFDLLCRQVESFLETDRWYVTVMSNVSALLYDVLPDLNWAGFYVQRGDRLVLGPFQGKPACIHIPKGRGVCGTALERNTPINVPDVHAFPGHIACDSASRSELVIPLHSGGKIAGVMDLDSPIPARFTEQDEAGLLRIAELLADLEGMDAL